MTQTLLELGITINIQDNPEHRILVKRDIPWNEAVELAIQCRKMSGGYVRGSGRRCLHEGHVQRNEKLCYVKPVGFKWLNKRAKLVK